MSPVTFKQEQQRSSLHHMLPRKQRIPLQRRAVSLINAVEEKAVGNTTHRLLEGTTAIKNVEGFLYLVPVNIGLGTFDLILDTGSSDTWVSCDSVADVSCKSFCPFSSVKIVYGSGEVCLETLSTTVEFGGLQLDRYTVGIGHGSNMDTPIESQRLLTGGAEGILGMAYGSIAQAPNPRGQIIDFMKSFSLYFTPTANDTGSFVMVDAVDQAIINDNGLKPHRVPLKRKEHWTVGLSNFAVGDDEIEACASPKDGTCDLFIDSGTAVIAVPTSVYSHIANEYLKPAGCEQHPQFPMFYLCPSSVKLPTLRFTFDGTTFDLPGDHYQTTITDGAVLVELRTLDVAPDVWILGATFLQLYYSEFVVNEAVTLYCPDGLCSPYESSSKTGLIIGIIVGVVGAIALAGLAIWFYRRRRRQQNVSQNVPQTSEPPQGSVDHAFRDVSTPAAIQNA